MEQRELPALERFEQLRVSGSCGEPALKLNGELGAEGIEARRLPRGHLRGKGRHRAHAVRPPVQALEEHRARRDGTRRRESQDADGEADLGRGVGHLARTPVEVALELEDEHAVDLAPEVAGRRRPASGHEAVSSPAAAGRTRMPRPSSISPPAVSPTRGASAA